jgi:hypothetical protein
MMTDLQLLYLLANYVAEHLEAHEVTQDRGLLASDNIRGLMKEMEEKLNRQHMSIPD